MCVWRGKKKVTGPGYRQKGEGEKGGICVRRGRRMKKMLKMETMNCSKRRYKKGGKKGKLESEEGR